MNNFFENSVFFGVCISLFSYYLGTLLRKKWNFALCNPLLISIILTILFLVGFHIDYDTYYEGAKYISYLLTPATICLAVPLYEQFTLLKQNYKAVLIGMLSGVLASIGSVLLFALLFAFDHKNYVSFLPKSITTAIGMGVSEELGGYVPITVAVIVITGLVGNMIAESVCKIFRITHPIAKGIAIGSSSHAMGTARAMEMGEIEGAMSSLSIVVSGILTVVASGLFANLIP